MLKSHQLHILFVCFCLPNKQHLEVQEQWSASGLSSSTDTFQPLYKWPFLHHCEEFYLHRHLFNSTGAGFQSCRRSPDADMKMAHYCKRWRLTPSIKKAVSSCFHLYHKKASKQLNISLNGHRLDNNPIYLGQGFATCGRRAKGGT